MSIIECTPMPPKYLITKQISVRNAKHWIKLYGKNQILLTVRMSQFSVFKIG